MPMRIIGYIEYEEGDLALIDRFKKRLPKLEEERQKRGSLTWEDAFWILFDDDIKPSNVPALLWFTAWTRIFEPVEELLLRTAHYTKDRTRPTPEANRVIRRTTSDAMRLFLRQLGIDSDGCYQPLTRRPDPEELLCGLLAWQAAYTCITIRYAKNHPTVQHAFAGRRRQWHDMLMESPKHSRECLFHKEVTKIMDSTIPAASLMRCKLREQFGICVGSGDPVSASKGHVHSLVAWPGFYCTVVQRRLLPGEGPRQPRRRPMVRAPSGSGASACTATGHASGVATQQKKSTLLDVTIGHRAGTEVSHVHSAEENLDFDTLLESHTTSCNRAPVAAPQRVNNTDTVPLSNGARPPASRLQAPRPSSSSTRNAITHQKSTVDDGVPSTSSIAAITDDDPLLRTPDTSSAVTRATSDTHGRLVAAYGLPKKNPTQSSARPTSASCPITTVPSVAPIKVVRDIAPNQSKPIGTSASTGSKFTAPDRIAKQPAPSLVSVSGSIIERITNTVLARPVLHAYL